MALIFWGRGLLIGGVVAAMLSAAPGLIFSWLPPGFSDGFAGLLAALLLLTVTPLALLLASAGAIALLVGLFRRHRSGS